MSSVGWLETNATPIGTKRVDTTEGDGDRVDIRSNLVATELKIHQEKIGILRDDVFSATPPVEAGRLLRSLMTTESKQAKSHKLMFIDISSAHFFSPSRRRVCVELLPQKEKVRLVWSVTQEHVRNTRRGGEFCSGRHGHIDEHEIRGWILELVVVHIRQQGHQTASSTAATS